MIKALLKGGGLYTIGFLPGGPRAYRYMTREVMGTQRGHIFKLQRIWPMIIGNYIEVAGGTLEGRIVLHLESGWTPISACMNYLTSGRGGVLVTTRVSGARLLERHVTESINEALNTVHTLERVTPVPEERIHGLDRMRWRKDLAEFLHATETEYYPEISPHAFPLNDHCVDFIYSGGSLEHYPAPELRACLGEAHRVLKPGGILGVIIDHSDHLHHHDQRLPFLYHYSIPDRLYSLTRRNPLLFHNRLAPGEVMKMLEEAGFERARLLRKTLPTNRFFEDGEDIEGEIGINRRRLLGRYCDLSDCDLKTAAAFYIYRKL